MTSRLDLGCIRHVKSQTVARFTSDPGMLMVAHNLAKIIICSDPVHLRPSSPMLRPRTHFPGWTIESTCPSHTPQHDRRIQEGRRPTNLELFHRDTWQPACQPLL